MLEKKWPSLCAEKLTKISCERLSFSEVIAHNSVEVLCMSVDEFISSAWILDNLVVFAEGPAAGIL